MKKTAAKSIPAAGGERRYNVKAIMAGWLIALAGTAISEALVAVIYILAVKLSGGAPEMALDVAQIVELTGDSNLVLGAGLFFGFLFTLLGGYTTAYVAGAESAKDPKERAGDIKVMAILCELTEIVLALTAGVTAPAWYYVIALLFPVPLAWFGWGWRIANHRGGARPCAAYASAPAQAL